MTGPDNQGLPGAPRSSYPNEQAGGTSTLSTVAGPVAAAVAVAGAVAGLRARSDSGPRAKAKSTTKAAQKRVGKAQKRVGKAQKRTSGVPTRALRSTGATAGAALRMPPRAVSSTAGAVTHRAEHAAQTGRKTVRRIVLLTVSAAGYVLGTRAGRERYDEIVQKGRELVDRPEVQPIKEKLDQATKGGQGQHEAPAPTTYVTDPVGATYPATDAPVLDPSPRPFG